MNSKEKLPTPKDLLPTPQLAVLSMLENTLEMVLRMLFAQHPDLYDHEKPYWVRTDLASVMAEEVIAAIGRLSSTLDGYLHMLAADIENAPNSDDDIFPF